MQEVEMEWVEWNGGRGDEVGRRLLGVEVYSMVWETTNQPSDTYIRDIMGKGPSRFWV